MALIFNDPTESCNIGDIIIGENNKNKFRIPAHPIVYLGPLNDHEFIGALISTKRTNGNIPMLAEHFEIQDENGNPYPIIYGPSFLGNKPYKKKMEWNPFEMTGRLTQDGLAYVQQQLEGYIPGYFKLNKR